MSSSPISPYRFFTVLSAIMFTVVPLPSWNFSYFPLTSRVANTRLGLPAEATVLSCSSTAITATYSSSSDSHSLDKTFFFDYWQQTAIWFRLTTVLAWVCPCRTVFLAKGCCLAQDLQTIRWPDDSLMGLAGGPVLFLPAGDFFSSFTQRTSSWFIALSCLAEVSEDLHICIHWLMFSLLVWRSFLRTGLLLIPTTILSRVSESVSDP